MYRINPENVDYLYFLPSDDVSDAVSSLELELKWPNALTREQWNRLREVRLVGVPWPWSGKILLRLLYWGDREGLEALDQRVAAGAWSSADFEDSIQTQLSQTRCNECGCIWRTLVALNDPYLGAPGLLERKFGAWERAWKRCPSCGASLRRFVVKIYDECG